MFDIEQTLKNSKWIINFSAWNPIIMPKTADLLIKENLRFLASRRDAINRVSASEWQALNKYKEAICRYWSSQWLKSFIEAIMKLMKRYYPKIKEENILITPWSQILYYYAINTFCWDFWKWKVKKLLLPQSPEYTGYSNMWIDTDLTESIKPIIKILDNHSFKYYVDFDKFDLKDVWAIAFSRPCNPSWNLLTNKETEQIIAKARKKNIPVFIDSAYTKPIPNLSYVDMKLYFGEGIVHTMSFSKAGLAWERIWVAIWDKDIIAVLRAFQTNACIHSSKFWQLVSWNILWDLEKLCETEIKKFYYDKILLTDKLFKKYFDDKIPYYLHKWEWTIFRWIWFKNLPITDWELYQEFKKAWVITVPWSTFFPWIKDKKWKHQRECIRLSLTASDQDLEKWIKIMGQVVKKIYK